MTLKPIALVTGASSGIGKALSYELVSQGYLVLGIARSSDLLSLIAQDLKDNFIPFTCDVSRKQEIVDTSNSIVAQKFYPNLFFLNAGLAGEAAAENPNKFDLSMHEKIMQVNYFGVLNWVEFWEKPCMDHGGANFIVTSSINAFFAPPLGSAYSASKAAIAKAFESLSLTYFKTNLRFSVVYPGPVETQGLKGKLPFTWSPQKMASRMVNFALSNKESYEPSSFYKALTRLLNLLPNKYKLKAIGQ